MTVSVGNVVESSHMYMNHAQLGENSVTRVVELAIFPECVENRRIEKTEVNNLQLANTEVQADQNTDDGQDSEPDYVYSLPRHIRKLPTCLATVHSHPDVSIDTLIDSGSSKNIMDQTSEAKSTACDASTKGSDVSLWSRSPCTSTWSISGNTGFSCKKAEICFLKNT